MSTGNDDSWQEREPLTDETVDVSGLSGFMLDVDRLLSSELIALASGDEFKAAVLLWSRAWKQVPPASLPDDDRVLASFAGLGANLPKWRKVRPMAMRGFIKCADGRWYHPVLATDAKRASRARQQRRDAIASRYGKGSGDGTNGPTKPSTKLSTGEVTGEATAVPTDPPSAELPVLRAPRRDETRRVSESNSENRESRSRGAPAARSRARTPNGAAEGIDWQAIVGRMTARHGFEPAKAWEIAMGCGERKDLAMRIQGAMRKAEGRGKSAFGQIATIAAEASSPPKEGR
jgi:hypothetical protein